MNNQYSEVFIRRALELGSKGLAICSELSYMAEEILAGGWFE